MFTLYGLQAAPFTRVPDVADLLNSVPPGHEKSRKFFVNKDNSGKFQPKRVLIASWLTPQTGTPADFRQRNGA
jgi:hypothetical protein